MFLITIIVELYKGFVERGFCFYLMNDGNEDLTKARRISGKDMCSKYEEMFNLNSKY